MPADLENVFRFFDNADQYAAFLQRVQAAVVEKAVALRAGAAPSPVTEAWRARQLWAVQVLSSPDEVTRAARALLPALAVKANDAGLLSEQGVLTATDAQIRATLDDDFVDMHTGYVPEAS